MDHLLLGNDGRLQWETLVTGFGAVVAAVLTIRNLKQQMRQADELAADQRKRRERAARAMLPLALEELAQYATASIAGLWALRHYFTGDGSLNRSRVGKPPPGWAPLPLAEYVLSVIKECIEFLDAVPAEALADLMRRFQVQNSQLRAYISILSLTDRGSQLSWNSMKEVIIESAELCALARHFSHGIDSEDFTIGGDSILLSLFNAKCFDDDDIDEANKLTEEWKRWRGSTPRQTTVATHFKR